MQTNTGDDDLGGTKCLWLSGVGVWGGEGEGGAQTTVKTSILTKPWQSNTVFFSFSILILETVTSQSFPLLKLKFKFKVFKKCLTVVFGDDSWRRQAGSFVFLKFSKSFKYSS